MTKFSNKYKKTLFLAHFPHFWGKNIFSRNSDSVTCNTTWAPNTTQSLKKNKLMSQCQENVWTEERKDRRTD